MKKWQQLVKLALMGTDKNTLPEAMLPEAVRQRLPASDAGDREGHFYKAAALTWLYEKTAYLPEKHPVPDIEPAPEEPRQPMPESVAAFVEQLIARQDKRTELLIYCFEKIAARNWVLPTELIVPVLQLCTQPPYKALQPYVWPVAGTRGRWMQQFNPEWNYLEPPDVAALWEDGSGQTRRRFVHELRLTAPDKAFDFLKEAWVEETNARERKEWLKILQITPQPRERAFVEDLYEELLQQKDQSRPIFKETLRLVVEILLAQPQSALFEAVTGYLKARFGKSKTVQLPEKRDDFFSVEWQCGKLGFEAVSPFKNGSEPAYWCSELLRLLHPVAWEQIWDASWPEIIQRFEKSHELAPKAEFSLLHLFSSALARTGYTPAIQAYVATQEVNDSNYYMLQYLNEPELEYFVQNRFPGALPAFLTEILQRKNWVWSFPLSRFVLDKIVQHQRGNWNTAELNKLLPLGMHFNLQITTEVIRLASDQNSADWQMISLRKHFIIPLLTILQSRHKIENF